jgi:hypothetical protein
MCLDTRVPTTRMVSRTVILRRKPERFGFPIPSSIESLRVDATGLHFADLNPCWRCRRTQNLIAVGLDSPRRLNGKLTRANFPTLPQRTYPHPSSALSRRSNWDGQRCGITEVGSLEEKTGVPRMGSAVGVSVAISSTVGVRYVLGPVASDGQQHCLRRDYDAQA